MLFDPNKPEHAHAERCLHSNTIIWLGTTRPDDRPHLVPVWFLWDGENILIFSKPDQKIRNLRNNPNVMLGLDETGTGEFIALVEGTARLLEHGSVATTMPAYVEKYGDRIEVLGWTPESMAEEFTEPISVTPTKLLAWDG